MQAADPRDIAIFREPSDLLLSSAHTGGEMWVEKNIPTTYEKIFGRDWSVIRDWIKTNPKVWEHLGKISETGDWLPAGPQIFTSPSVRQLARQVEARIHSYAPTYLLLTIGELIAGAYKLDEDLFAMSEQIEVPANSLLTMADGDLSRLGISRSQWQAVPTGGVVLDK
jgi:hypothetical protein